MLYKVISLTVAIVLFFSITTPNTLQAQEEHQETTQPISEVVHATVHNIQDEFNETIPGTNTTQKVQILNVELTEGPRSGEIVEVRNDYLPLRIGSSLYVIHDESFGDVPRYFVQDIDRTSSLIFFVIICMIAVIVLGSWYGVRSLISLFGSLLVLWFVLIPGLARGWDPLIACFVVTSVITAGMLFFTHGANRQTIIALSGTLCSVIITLIIAKLAIHYSYISGFSMEASTSLSFNTNGTIDLVGLLIGGIVIGALGVLDDVAVTQVAVVREIKHSAPKMHKREVFIRAMRVGREHVGAVVNTLALAYTGVSLPLILLFYMGNISIGTFFNMEIIAVEILRTIIGTIGIVLTVPLVTALAVYFINVKGIDKKNTPII